MKYNRVPAERDKLNTYAIETNKSTFRITSIDKANYLLVMQFLSVLIS